MPPENEVRVRSEWGEGPYQHQDSMAVPNVLTVPLHQVVYSEGNEAAMSFQEFVGWSASAVLVLTIVTQVYRQWQLGSSKGVSKWLFIGQMMASSGFLLYSWLIHDVVFLFTNALMMMSAAVGLSIVLWHRMKRRDEEDVREPPIRL